MITKEDFWKLKQSDRIEYFLLQEHYNKKYSLNVIQSFNGMIPIFLLYIIITMLFYPINQTIAYKLASAIPSLVYLIVLITAAVFLFDVYNLIKHKEKANELARRYFKVEPK